MSTPLEWIDIHTHLDGLEDDVETSIQRAKDAGVTRMITIGTQPDDHGFVVETAQRYPGTVYGTLGVHPHEATRMNPEVSTFIRENARHPSIVGIGEIGLDYFYEYSDRNVQIPVFEEHLQIARDLNLPVEIHTRDAEADTISVLKNFGGHIRGVVHCFTGTQWLAEQALDLGLNISISGIVTFKNAQSLRDTVKTIPLNRLHVETDAPYLTPAPHRGKKNTPAYVTHTAEFVSILKGQELSVFCTQMKQNAESVFTKLL